MKKWYFSDNGQVSGPYSLADASELLSNSKDIYGWNPSLSHWLPVEQISDLKEIFPQSKPEPQVSNELITKFVKKRRELNKKVKLIDEAIKVTENNLEALDNVVKKYIQLTDGLSDEVKANIEPVKKKKTLLSKQLVDLTKALSIAKSEIIEVVKEFGELVLHNNSSDSDELLDLDYAPEIKTIVKETKTLKKKTEKDKTEDKKIEVKAKSEEIIKKSPISIVSDRPNEQPKTLDVNDKRKITKSVVETDKLTTVTAPQAHKNALDKVHTEKEEIKSGADKVSSKSNLFTLPELFNIEKPDYSDVKSKFKSVFKPKEEEPAMRLSDRLKEIDSAPAKVAEFSESSSDYLDEGEQKKKRRRRRR